MPKPRTLREMLPPWHSIYGGDGVPLAGQVVLVAGHTYRNPPYGTYYGLARFRGAQCVNAWTGMDGVILREDVQYWRELSLTELPFEL